jgi:predicted nucleotidyltransferase
MVSMQGTNPDSQWRFNIARQVACIYAQNRDTTAIMVDGSAGRGHTDRISDIEIGVFWHKPPTEATRARVVERAGADLIQLYPFFKNEQVWCDDYMVGWPKSKQPQSSLLTEVTHHTAESMQGTLDSVLLSPNPDLVKQKTDLWCLGGDPHLGAVQASEWKSRAAITA